MQQSPNHSTEAKVNRETEASWAQEQKQDSEANWASFCRYRYVLVKTSLDGYQIPSAMNSVTAHSESLVKQLVIRLEDNHIFMIKRCLIVNYASAWPVQYQSRAFWQPIELQSHPATAVRLRNRYMVPLAAGIRTLRRHNTAAER